ncbi:YIP1 family protein [Methanoregula sp.]|uniref:YIP1 family protein n=1 Tax=Methanoregula sp. TaxID=2052170 RepID=UPI003BB1A2D6
MIDTLVAKVKGFLLDPVETFRQSKTDAPKSVFTFFGVLLLVNAILSTIIVAAGIEAMNVFGGTTFGAALPVVVFFIVLVGGFIFTLIFAAWTHLWVYVLGGRKGIMQTVNAILYGSTPHLLLGWIPFIGIIFTLWTLVLNVLGIRELQELSTGKAILAVVIAVIIPLVIILLSAAWFMTSYMSMTEVPVPPANC